VREEEEAGEQLSRRKRERESERQWGGDVEEWRTGAKNDILFFFIIIRKGVEGG